jgi:hypothetical protein
MGLRRQLSNPLRFPLQILFSLGVTEAEIEQLQDDLLLFQARGFGQRFDGIQIAFWEIAAANVLQVVEHRFPRIDKELLFRLEVAELQNQMDRGRSGTHGTDCRAFGRTQVEVEMAVILSEARQAIEVINLPGGEDRQAARIGRHAATFSTCQKYTFRTPGRRDVLTCSKPRFSMQKPLR